jgi:hypothetical protein
MLVWEGQGLDLQAVWPPKQAVDIDTQGMSSQLAVESCTQTPESVGAVRLDVELLTQLAVYRLNDLSHGIEQSLDFGRHLPFLVTAW